MTDDEFMKRFRLDLWRIALEASRELRRIGYEVGK